MKLMPTGKSKYHLVQLAPSAGAVDVEVGTVVLVEKLDVLEFAEKLDAFEVNDVDVDDVDEVVDEVEDVVVGQKYIPNCVLFRPKASSAR